jgi:hypothetical protein
MGSISILSWPMTPLDGKLLRDTIISAAQLIFPVQPNAFRFPVRLAKKGEHKQWRFFPIVIEY